jgi:sugar lactone lactonase YvrE
MRIAATLVALLLTLPAASAKGSSALTPPLCQDTAVRANVFYSAPAAWFENLGFDGRGGLWVGEIGADRVVRLDPTGAVRAGFSLPYPGAIEPGPDGKVYANFGDSLTGGYQRTGQAGVVRFDPTAAAPTPQTFASGLNMANGGAFDSAGNLYVSDTVNGGVTKFRPDDSVDTTWTQAAQIPSANGLAIAGNVLYVTNTDATLSTVYRVPLGDPAARTVAAELGPLKGLDDLAIGADGRLYVTSVRGDLVRVDPRSGAACLLFSGPPLTSARFASHFAPFDRRTDLFVTSETGVLIHLHLTHR